MVSVVKKLLPGAAGTAGAGGGDDDFNLVTGLYHFDGSNGAQNSTFIDSSDNNLTVTAGSDVPPQGTFSPFSADEGKWSGSFDGGTAQNQLTIASTADFAFGTGDYTLEAWVYPYSLFNSATLGNFVIDFRSSGNTGGNYMYIGVNGSGDGVLVPVSGNAVAGITLNAWNHIAVARESSTERTFINGVLKGSNTNTTNFSSNATATIGTRYAAASGGSWCGVDGFISNLRVVKGTAVYTSAFTPSTSPLTAVTNTKLLTCCSNRIRDKSTSAHSFTVAGVPKIKPFGPFKNSAEYDPAVHGGSFLFEQNANSYLEADHATLFDFGTADQCIEAWLYPTQTSFSNSWAMWFNTKGVNQYWAYTDGGGNSAAAGFSTYPTNTYSASNAHILVPYTWNHCVFQTTGGVQNWYLNGTRIYEATTNPNFSSSATGVRIGNSPAYASYFYYGGYMSDVRVTTGTNYNPYSNAATLTVPTAPLTKGSYTRLLLNGTNAALKDVSGKTNIETLGSAQLDTSVKKFGTASAEFDGNTDRLALSKKDFAPVGTQSFTIECFIYVNAHKNYNGIYSAGAGIQLYVEAGGKLASWIGTAAGSFAPGNFQSSGTISTTTWTHIALVRDSANSTLTYYINGTASGQTTSFTTVIPVVTSTSVTIGSYESGTYSFNGFIDEMRITHKARYTSNFDVPTEAFPNI